MRVLICDDHAVFAESLAVVLRRAGFEIIGATRSIDGALAELRRARVDVCVLDMLYSPPLTLNGDALTRPAEVSSIGRLPELRAAAPSTRFLLLTGRLTVDLVARARLAGVSGFAHKGCRIQDLASAISRVHAGEVVLDITTLRPEARSARRLSPVQRSAAHPTSRERQVLGHLVTGADTTTVAKALGVSWTTARSHIQNVLTKLGAHSRLEAAAAAVRDGVVRGDTGEWLM